MNKYFRAVVLDMGWYDSWDLLLVHFPNRTTGLLQVKDKKITGDLELNGPIYTRDKLSIKKNIYHLWGKINLWLILKTKKKDELTVLDKLSLCQHK